MILPLVRIYSKPGCHLCEAVEQLVKRARKSRPFRLEICDIRHDAEAWQRYREAIPVVTVNGEEIARYRLSNQELVAALHRCGPHVSSDV